MVPVPARNFRPRATSKEARTLPLAGRPHRDLVASSLKAEASGRWISWAPGEERRLRSTKGGSNLDAFARESEFLRRERI